MLRLLTQKILLTVSLALSVSICFSLSETSGDSEFKSEFTKAYDLIAKDNYKEAVVILEKLNKEQPQNANLKSMLGYCYLRTGKTYEKAIEYYSQLNFPDDFTINYQDRDANETHAPLEALLYQGESYHMNYEFEKALEIYNQYLSMVRKGNSDEYYFANKRVEEVTNAIEFSKQLTGSELFEIRPLNTEYPDYRPIPNATGDLMYFTSRRRRKDGTSEQKKDDDGAYYEDVYQVEYCRGVWGEPQPIAQLNSEFHEAILYLSNDENKILVYRFGEDDENGGDVFESEFKNGSWSPLKKLSEDINSPSWETHSSISSQDIVFTSDRKGTRGFRDIWLYDAKTKSISNMGKTINTEEDEDGAFLTEDGKTLYFSSNGHNTMGGFDIFVSHKDESGKWSEPKNLGMPINSPGDDIFYHPVVKGGDAYFSSFRNAGSGNQDLYFIPNMDRINAYEGLVMESSGKPVERLVVSIFNVETKEEVRTVETDEDGKFRFYLNPGESYQLLPYFQKGKILEKEPDMELEELGSEIMHRDEVVDAGHSKMMADNDVNWLKLTKVEAILSEDIAQAHLDAIAEPVAVIDSIPANPIDSAVTAANNQFDINNILFVFDKITIIKSSRKDLKKLATIMKENKDLKLEITGYTDGLGDPRYNKRLSRERAKKVQRELVKRGIEESRITLNWKGMKDPVAANQTKDGKDNPEGRQLNRRTEFNFVR